MVRTGDGEEVEGSVFSAESLEVLTGDEGTHAETDEVDGAALFDVGFDVVAQFGSEILEAFASVPWFEGGGESFDSALLERFLHGFEDFSGVPESVHEDDERGF